jgi:hypothetical protein
MDASAIVQSTDHRPTLGRVSVGPLGDTHSDIIEAILHKQKKKNPLRRFRDTVNDCCYTVLVNCEKMIPSEVSEDLRMERTRPMSAEVKLVIFLIVCLFFIVVLFLYAMVTTTQVALSWEGDATCEILDFVMKDVVTDERKFIMRLTNSTKATGKLIEDQKSSMIAAFEAHGEGHGWDSHHDGLDEDNPLACHVLRNHLEPGPCCHSTFKVYPGRDVGDIFPCYFSFDTDYCSDYGEFGDFDDDDFRGFGKDANKEWVLDHRNRMCCEPEMPIMISRMTWLFVIGTMIALTLLWCLAFRAKTGVWSRLCPFDMPPATAHIYDVTHEPKKKNMPESMERD